MNTTPETTVPPRTFAPALLLVLLAPLFSELLSGSIRFTSILVVLPATGVWGCAALLIREAARRWSGRRTLVALALALAVAEEIIIQQTSLAPLVGQDPAHIYGRAAGVNWTYLIWAIGFEAVWAVIVPVIVVELVYPQHRDSTWLRRRGLWINGAIASLASFAAWYSWTQVFVPKFFPQAQYHPPLPALLLGLALIGGLIAYAATGRDGSAHVPRRRSVPGPFVAGLVAFLLALPWYLQVLAAFNAWPHLPVAVPCVVAAALVAMASQTVFRWAGDPAFTAAARYAIVIGLVVATAIGGACVLAVSGAGMIDRVAQLAFNALVLFWLWRRSRRAPLATVPLAPAAYSS